MSFILFIFVGLFSAKVFAVIPPFPQTYIGEMDNTGTIVDHRGSSFDPAKLADAFIGRGKYTNRQKKDIYGKVYNHHGGVIFTKRDIYGKVDNFQGGVIYSKRGARGIYGVVNNHPGGQINGVPIYTSSSLAMDQPASLASGDGMKRNRHSLVGNIVTGLGVANMVDQFDHGGSRFSKRDYYGKVNSENAAAAAAASRGGDCYGKLCEADHPELFN